MLPTSHVLFVQLILVNPIGGNYVPAGGNIAPSLVSHLVR